MSRRAAARVGDEQVICQACQLPRPRWSGATGHARRPLLYRHLLPTLNSARPSPADTRATGKGKRRSACAGGPSYLIAPNAAKQLFMWSVSTVLKPT